MVLKRGQPRIDMRRAQHRQPLIVQPYSGHIVRLPWQEHLRLRIPLPLDLFFLLSILKQTSSFSNHMHDCSLPNSGELGSALHVGRAYKRNGGILSTQRRAVVLLSISHL